MLKEYIDMKKLLSIAAILASGVLLAGCYSKGCEQPGPAPMPMYKGEEMVSEPAMHHHKHMHHKHMHHKHMKKHKHMKHHRHHKKMMTNDVKKVEDAGTTTTTETTTETKAN
jgi:hypothetical protein